MDFKNFTYIVDLITKNLDSNLKRLQSLEYIAQKAMMLIKKDATENQLLNGKRHSYISEDYKSRKRKGTAKGQDLNKVKTKAVKMSHSTKGKKIASQKRKLKVFSAVQPSKRKSSTLGHNTQNQFVDMWLTGAMWDSFKIKSLGIKEGVTSIQIGVEDEHLMKIKGAEALGRNVIALSETNQDLVANMFAEAKILEILDGIPSKMTIIIGEK